MQWLSEKCIFMLCLCNGVTRLLQDVTLNKFLLQGLYITVAFSDCLMIYFHICIAKRKKVKVMSIDSDNTTSQEHILVASSDCADCDLIRSHFESFGYEIECCKSLRDVYMTDLTPYSLVLLELTDNIDEGLHAIESIKQNSNGGNTAVLVYSASKRSDILVDALNAGADDYVIKPFSVRELSARVRAVLRSTRRG